ncbi:hypothetical protein [Arundinibacter roseus]|uniref:Uncharacterized protein n=1 Tax=Arundinibacter roseus TaxID=2070510 RepID=A0A4R4KG89_9BACT|nr:hypothetical protein [Arundinibacter roseus]TDB65912.1 hypothetical protein EZE20_09090 [Arundinibacter roseus]
MKNNRKDQILIIALFVVSALFLAKAGIGSTLRENGEDSFHFNPLLVDGKPMDFGTLKPGMKGTLTVMSANPASPEAEQISFRVYLRRGEKTVTETSEQVVNQADLGELLKVAMEGDQLVVEPAQEIHQKSRRVLRIVLYKGIQWFPTGIRQDGC